MIFREWFLTVTTTSVVTVCPLRKQKKEMSFCKILKVEIIAIFESTDKMFHLTGLKQINVIYSPRR